MKKLDDVTFTNYMQRVMENAKDTSNTCRIFEGKATIDEALTELSIVIKPSVYRDRLSDYMIKRQRPLNRFENDYHKQQFEALITNKNYCDNFYMAALYLLTADRNTWRQVREIVTKGGINYDLVEKIPSGIGYTLFQVARDLTDGTGYLSLNVLAEKQIIGDHLFTVLSKAFAICRFGVGAVGITKKNPDEEVVIFKIDKRRK